VYTSIEIIELMIFMVRGHLLETLKFSTLVAHCLEIKFSVCISFVVFLPSAGRKWLITVNKSCARVPLVNVPLRWTPVENHS